MSDRPWQIMIASSNLENRQRLVRILERQGIDPIWASTVAQCREIFETENIGLVFCDRYLTDGDYHGVIAASAPASGKTQSRIVLTALLTNAELYEEAKRQGVFEVIPTPCRPTDVEWMIIQAKRDGQKRERPVVAGFRAGRPGAETIPVR